MSTRAYSRFDMPRDQVKWMDHARCANEPVDPELFFYNSTSGHPADLLQKRQAESFCKPCPVRLACLAYGQLRAAHGHWGGFGAHARSRQRNLEAAVCRT